MDSDSKEVLTALVKIVQHQEKEIASLAAAQMALHQYVADRSQGAFLALASERNKIEHLQKGGYHELTIQLLGELLAQLEKG